MTKPVQTGTGPIRERKSGAGVHGDRRTKRLRTRGKRKEQAIKEQS